MLSPSLSSCCGLCIGSTVSIEGGGGFIPPLFAMLETLDNVAIGLAVFSYVVAVVMAISLIVWAFFMKDGEQ